MVLGEFKGNNGYFQNGHDIILSAVRATGLMFYVESNYGRNHVTFSAKLSLCK